MKLKLLLLFMCIFSFLCACQSNNLADSPSPSPEPNPTISATSQPIIIPSSPAEPETTKTISDNSDEIIDPTLSSDETPNVSQSPPSADDSEATPTSAPEHGNGSPIPSNNSTNSKLIVLMYHHVVADGEYCTDWTVTVSRLREDLQWLADNGYTTVLPRELKQGMSLPEKAVMITFDDGYTSNYTLAFPLLQEFNAKAVISLIVSTIDWGVTHAVTWDMCREMQASGLIEFGSHSYALHENGIVRNRGETQDAYEKRVFSDITKSIDLIRENLDYEPCFFAYPFGKTDAWANSFLEDTFFMTVTCKAAVADISNGTIDLPRYNINMKQKASHCFD